MDSKVELIVLKLGGSVITVKEKPLTANEIAINRLIKEICRANVDSVIVVHGGGSFGHFLAKKYKIIEGYKNPSQLEGFAKTRQAMMALNKIIIDAFIDKGIPAVGIPPSACILTENGRISRFETRSIEKMLDLGITPVMYGDAVLDEKLGFTILSGDQIISKLSISLRTSRIVIGLDVDGLYTADPKTNSEAKLIGEISLRELRSVLNNVSGSSNVDVTGGMSGKMSEIIPVLENNIPIIMVNANVPNRLFKAMRNEEVKGTKLFLD